MPFLSPRRSALVALSLFGALGRAPAQATIDTLSIAKIVGRAVGREAKYAGPYSVDTSGTGSRISLAAIQASGLRVELLSGANPPACKFNPTKKDPASPFLFSLVIESVTTERAVVWSEVRCDPGAVGSHLASVRYILRCRNGHWRLLPGRRVIVT